VAVNRRSLPYQGVHVGNGDVDLPFAVGQSFRKAELVEISGELIVPTAAREGELIVRVRDNGLGVPQKAREHLFEQFFRAHSDSVTAEGTGLGLNIVHETVASLGGRTWAEFPDEGGSVFAFSLPSRREEDAAAGTRRPDVTPEITEAPAAG
jgi:light-regulated signal transduction histidine kinase (bacteriophytochrome)